MKTPYVYCIFRLNQKEYQHINDDLSERGYKGIKSIIPTVSILKKNREGKNYYDEIPLLFNFGFMKMKSDKAFDRNFLRKIRKDIPGVLSFLQSVETLHARKLRRRVDNAEDWDDFSIVATVSKKDVKHYQRVSKLNRIYSKDDLLNIKPGTFVILRGYPYEGMPATIVDINHISGMAKVLLESNLSKIETTLPIENIFYSIYRDFDEDRLYSIDYEIDLSTITDGEPDELLSSKQF